MRHRDKINPRVEKGGCKLYVLISVNCFLSPLDLSCNIVFIIFIYLIRVGLVPFLDFGFLCFSKI